MSKIRGEKTSRCFIHTRLCPFKQTSLPNLNFHHFQFLSSLHRFATSSISLEAGAPLPWYNNQNSFSEEGKKTNQEMEAPGGILCRILLFIIFLPIFDVLIIISTIKAILFAPLVFTVISLGDVGVIVGLWPLHLFWTSFCIARSKKFGPYLKCLLILFVPIPIALWTAVGILGTLGMGLFHAYIWPVMETFKAISKPGVRNKLRGCIEDGAWSSVDGAKTTVRDFADFSFHSYFSVMDELFVAKPNQKPVELKVTMVPGCTLAAVLGLWVDVPMITLIVIYKAPVMLFKGWHRLVEDLIGRSGPFLESVCVPFAGLLVVLWPFAVLLAILVGILSSFGYGCYAAVVAYQENSTKKGLLYVIASVSLFDEYTNDFLYMREGSCFPRPQYRENADDDSQLLPRNGLHEQLVAINARWPMMPESSEKIKAVKAVVIWDNFFKVSEHTGKALVGDGAIGILDLEEWKQSKNKIINIGLPSYTFLQCFLRSIKSGSTGFLMRDNVEVTHLNRPEGRVFDWLYEPMCVMKEQIKCLNLTKSEELYLCKLSLYCGNANRVEAWRNGGVTPVNEIKRAQLEAISRRLQGFCLTLSRLPTFRRRLYEVVNAMMQDAKQVRGNITGDIEAAV